LTKANPENAEGWINLGISYTNEGNFDDEETLYNKAFAHMSLLEFDEANKIYDEILNTNPFHVGAIANKGAIQCENGNYREGIEFFDNALKIESKSVTVIRNKVQAVELLGDKESANELYNHAMALEFGYPL
jgi:tetratricopeptide (TPR) repeat protein